MVLRENGGKGEERKLRGARSWRVRKHYCFAYCTDRFEFRHKRRFLFAFTSPYRVVSLYLSLSLSCHFLFCLSHFAFHAIAFLIFARGGASIEDRNGNCI